MSFWNNYIHPFIYSRYEKEMREKIASCDTYLK